MMIISLVKLSNLFLLMHKYPKYSNTKNLISDVMVKVLLSRAID